MGVRRTRMVTIDMATGGERRGRVFQVRRGVDAVTCKTRVVGKCRTLALPFCQSASHTASHCLPPFVLPLCCDVLNQISAWLCILNDWARSLMDAEVSPHEIAFSGHHQGSHPMHANSHRQLLGRYRHRQSITGPTITASATTFTCMTSRCTPILNERDPSIAGCVITLRLVCAFRHARDPMHSGRHDICSHDARVSAS
jgi:hypothetical protein